MDKQQYDALKKEFPILPDYAHINHEFELSLIDQEEFLLRAIKRKIGEKMEPILDILERAITPDPNSFTDMYECRCFTNGDKKQLLDVFRHLMEHYRLLIETDLITEDQTDADTIRKIHDLWASEKKQAIPFIRKIRQCWQKHVEPKEILEYLG
ncbi:hypothetical protein HY489_03540 [Candidatus Woesearchaeota archaeon]|nr:hypothetical protein [Candidatus Woesearchaeota archaeon]